MKKPLLAAGLCVLGLSSTAYSEPANYGFEEGGTSGWAETYPGFEGRIDVVNGWMSGNGDRYSPVEGNYFAVLETGGPDGDYLTLSQKISLNGGETLEGWASFCCGDEVGYPYAGDNGDYNDYAIISIMNGSGDTVAKPWYADSFDIAYNINTPEGQQTGESVSFGPLPWEHWSWTAPEQGSYTLQYQTTQGGDSEGHSFALFDGQAIFNVKTLNTAVPEPSFFLLSGLGVAGIGALRLLSAEAFAGRRARVMRREWLK